MVYRAKVKNIDNDTIIKIYDLNTCINFDKLKWKQYKLLSLLDNLQQYNNNKNDEDYKKIDIYYYRQTLSNNKYPEAYNDFVKCINENIIDKNVGHSKYREKLQFWINKNNLLNFI